MNWAGVLNLMLWLVMMSVIHTRGQVEDENFQLVSNTLCSLVPVHTPMLGSGSGASWLNPDDSVFESDSGSGYLLQLDYSLMCDSLPTAHHTEEMSSVLPATVFLFTTLATVTSELIPASSTSSTNTGLSRVYETTAIVTPSPTSLSHTFPLTSILTTDYSLLKPSTVVTTLISSTFSIPLSVTTFSVPSSNTIPIPSPAPEDIVEVRLYLSELQYSQLQDSESPERAALEAALVQEYLQALNSSEGRTKRQAQPSVVAEITEVGPRNSTTGETPISFYIIDGLKPVPAVTVVNKLSSLSLQEIGGYIVISITVSPGVTVSAILSPTSGTTSHFGMPTDLIAGTVAIAVVVCCAAILLIAVLAYGLNRKFAKSNRKNFHKPPDALHGGRMFEQLRTIPRQDPSPPPLGRASFSSNQPDALQVNDLDTGEGLVIEAALTNQPGSSAIPFFPLLSKRHSSSVAPTTPSFSLMSSHSQLSRSDLQRQQDSQA